MKEQILFLVELQNIDLEIAKFMLRKVDLPKEITRLDEKLEAAEGELEESGQRLDKLKADHKAKETALKNGVENSKKAKSRLLAVKTNKEYEATLKEIDTINEKSSGIEDEIIHILEELDKVNEDLKVKESETASHRSRCENGKRKLEKELDSIGSVLDDVLKKRDKIRSGIKAKFLKKFDIIKDRKNGRAVVPARKEVCYGCHMNIPPQMYNELQKNERLMTCPHCERIIYWEGRDDDA
ncbi:MAG: C4-type zinc ribbon domain-containing protein [Thermodesulfobacteriota bacterium]|nr:C4-type zinc ribbon domain-containing protein [Thermodesulfobacteriota bacterium]